MKVTFSTILNSDNSKVIDNKKISCELNLDMFPLLQNLHLNYTFILTPILHFTIMIYIYNCQ